MNSEEKVTYNWNEYVFIVFPLFMILSVILIKYFKPKNSKIDRKISFGVLGLILGHAIYHKLKFFWHEHSKYEIIEFYGYLILMILLLLLYLTFEPKGYGANLLYIMIGVTIGHLFTDTAEALYTKDEEAINWAGIAGYIGMAIGVVYGFVVKQTLNKPSQAKREPTRFPGATSGSLRGTSLYNQPSGLQTRVTGLN